MAILPDLQNEPAMHSLDVPMASLTVNNKFSKAVANAVQDMAGMVEDATERSNQAETEDYLAAINKVNTEREAAMSQASTSEEYESFRMASDFNDPKNEEQYKKDLSRHLGRDVNPNVYNKVRSQVRQGFDRQYNSAVRGQYTQATKQYIANNKKHLMGAAERAQSSISQGGSFQGALQGLYSSSNVSEILVASGKMGKLIQKEVKNNSRNATKAVVSKQIATGRIREVDDFLKLVGDASQLDKATAISEGLGVHHDFSEVMDLNDIKEIRNSMGKAAKSEADASKPAIKQLRQASTNIKHMDRTSDAESRSTLTMEDIYNTKYIPDAGERRESVHKLLEFTVRNEALRNSENTQDTGRSFSEKEAKSIIKNIKEQLIKVAGDDYPELKNIELDEYIEILQEEKEKIGASFEEMNERNGVEIEQDLSRAAITKSQAIQNIKRKGMKVNVVNEDDIEAAFGDTDKFSKLLKRPEVKENMEDFKTQIIQMDEKVNPRHIALVDDHIAGKQRVITDEDYPDMSKGRREENHNRLITGDSNKSKRDHIEGKYDSGQEGVAKLLSEVKGYQGLYESMVESRQYYHLTAGSAKRDAKKASKLARKDVNEWFEETYDTVKVNGFFSDPVVVLKHRGDDKMISVAAPRGGYKKIKKIELIKKNIERLSEDVQDNPLRYMSKLQVNRIKDGSHDIVIESGISSGTEFNIKIKDNASGKKYDALDKNNNKLIIDRDFLEKWMRVTRSGTDLQKYD
jgi:hypothetical protein